MGQGISATGRVVTNSAKGSKSSGWGEVRVQFSRVVKATCRIGSDSARGHFGGGTVDKNRIVGSAKQVGGSIKKAVGKAIGDTKLQSEGAADQTEGKIQNAIGGLKDSIRDAVKK
jgi:uncharacterized protein YjbJ (UPF0337 family)